MRWIGIPEGSSTSCQAPIAETSHIPHRRRLAIDREDTPTGHLMCANNLARRENR